MIGESSLGDPGRDLSDSCARGIEQMNEIVGLCRDSSSTSNDATGLPHAFRTTDRQTVR
jgi:hypothetical protein